jgi:hypothetical protein
MVTCDGLGARRHVADGVFVNDHSMSTGRAVQSLVARQRTVLHAARKPRSLYSPHASASARTITTLPALDSYVALNYPDTSAPTKSARESLIAIKTRMLLDTIYLERPPYELVWTRYRDLLDVAGVDTVPLEIHQLVLRNAVPSPSSMRVHAQNKYVSVRHPMEPHPHEARMLAIMRNMRTGGAMPTLRDYHWVLDQFAAVGHYAGAERVLREMRMLGVEPVAASYGYVFQACAWRAEQPVKRERADADAAVDFDFDVGEGGPVLEVRDAARARMLRDLHGTFSRALAEMEACGVSMTPPNVDLVARLLRDHAEPAEFDAFVKAVYGLDLAFLDAAPLARTRIFKDTDALAAPKHVALSTHGLNVIIDTLGRQGRIQKMVEAFEVLTQPLRPASFTASAFDEDEDERAPAVSAPLHPWAEPNGTTFSLLLEHAGRTCNVALVRHYALLAFHTELASWRMRRAALERGETIPSPGIMLQARMLKPALHVANRTRRMPLLRWVRQIAGDSAKIKLRELVVLQLARERAEAETKSRLPVAAAEVAEARQPTLGLSPDATIDLASAPPTETEEMAPDASTDGVSSEGALSDGPSTDASEAATNDTPREGSTFAWLTTFFTPSTSSSDVAALAPTPRSPRPPLNVETHIRLLTKERDRLVELGRTVEDIHVRTAQRVKERLGRRVWRDADIYVRNADTRAARSRSEWRQSVHFWAKEELDLKKRRLWSPDELTERALPHALAAKRVDGRLDGVIEDEPLELDTVRFLWAVSYEPVLTFL